MEHDDLNILGKLNAPKPSDKARDIAVNSAMDAFDGVGDAAVLEKNSEKTQGNTTGERPTSIVNTLWSAIMNNVMKLVWNMKPATMATVAGVLMVPFAGVVAWNVMEPQGVIVPPVVEVAEQKVKLKSELDGRSEATVAQDDVAASSPVAQGARKNEGLGKLAAPKRLNRRVRAAKPVAGYLRKAKEAPMIAPAPLPNAEGEKFTEFKDNGVKPVKIAPVSTFSIDVDTASYARVRAMLNTGNLPPKDMVRVEEMVNYFDYSYALPENKAQPFKPTVTIMQTPWNEHTKLMHIGIKGFDIEVAEQPKANLVFLLDVSGSMSAPNKLPLLIKSFRLLHQKLNPTDTVSIVTYAGRAATLLKPTKASDRDAIINALENLRAGGSTGGAQGIEQAYRLAKQGFVEGGVNRVMLATDGDFNVGISNPEQLKEFIAKKRKTGIYLSVFGFGTGNYNDALMQSLAQNGNGQAAYIDTLAEAQKTLVEESGGTLFPIATDVKIQMEFNPAKIAEYRLIGYETRALKREDFNNDKVDAGDIGFGHTVTAIYELTPVGSPAVLTDPLRYDSDAKAKAKRLVGDPFGEIGFLKMRYKLPGESKSKLLKTAVIMHDPKITKFAFPQDATFATAVAAFGQKLRGNSAVNDYSYKEIAELASSAKGDDKFGYRSAFIQLVRMAGSLSK